MPLAISSRRHYQSFRFWKKRFFARTLVKAPVLVGKGEDNNGDEFDLLTGN